MFESIKKFFKRKEKRVAPVHVKTAKEIATEKGNPYVDILSMELDENNMGIGAFELDWNDKFVANLVRAGYQKSEKDSDADIVDRWFTDICRNVVLETWEQYEAMADVNDGRVIKSRNIGDGRSEVS
jgi:hypothetical protein